MKWLGRFPRAISELSEEGAGPTVPNSAVQQAAISTSRTRGIFLSGSEWSEPHNRLFLPIQLLSQSQNRKASRPARRGMRVQLIGREKVDFAPSCLRESTDRRAIDSSIPLNQARRNRNQKNCKKKSISRHQHVEWPIFSRYRN